MTINARIAALNVKRLTGMGAAATLALALLVFGCVLAATAGPREALNSRTQALRQTLASISPLDQSITASTTWNQAIESVDIPQGTFTSRQLRQLAAQFHAKFNMGVLHLAPLSADWVAMTSSEQTVLTALSGTVGHPVQMEVSYRLPDTAYVRVLAGSLAAPAAAASSVIAGFFPTINVAVTAQTAGQFGLKLGSVVRTIASPLASGTAVRLKVAAIVAERQPDMSFWTADPSLVAPVLNLPGTGPPYWTAGVFALPDETAAVQQDYGPRFLSIQWVFPINLGVVLGDQAPELGAVLQRIVTEAPPLTGQLAGIANVVMVSTGLQPVLSGFISTAAAVDALLWLLYVSLAVTGAIVLLLAARMIVLRRATELALSRARGASLLQVGLAAGRGAAIAGVPAAILAGAAAVLLVPGHAPPGGWWPALAVLTVAVGAPAVLGSWQQRSPRAGGNPAAGGYSRPGQPGRSQPSLGYGALGSARRGRRRFRGGVRLVAELTAVLAAIAGIIVFRQQGVQPGAGVDFYTSAAPALVAIPAVIIVLRLYPLILRGLLRGAARGRGATGFLGLARAARATLTPMLPAFALVLAITVAAFAGMVRDAVARGEINASWQTAGADVTISNVGLSQPIPAAAQRAFAAVPGVKHTAIVSEWMVSGPKGRMLTALAVDPASYSALVASSKTWPAIDPELLTGDRILASPQAVADFGGAKAVTLTIDNGIEPIRVQVAGRLSGTPALTAGGAFVLVPESLVARDPFVMPNFMLLNGPRIDTGRLTALANKLPGAVTISRAALLAQLTGAPVQGGAFLLFALALAVAAGLGLVVLLLQLALGGGDREATLARLATMGLADGQRARLVLLEAIPGIIAAAVAAVASALVLPRVVAPAINLSVFTGSTASVRLVPDLASIVLPIAGLIVVAAITLTLEIGARRGVVSTLREE
ncbi:MAG TPA: hypothetical protein VGI58_00635 [Streptosporangiaceae bacterium]